MTRLQVVTLGLLALLFGIVHTAPPPPRAVKFQFGSPLQGLLDDDIIGPPFRSGPPPSGRVRVVSSSAPVRTYTVVRGRGPPPPRVTYTVGSGPPAHNSFAPQSDSPLGPGGDGPGPLHYPEDKNKDNGIAPLIGGRQVPPTNRFRPNSFNVPSSVNSVSDDQSSVNSGDGANADSSSSSGTGDKPEYNEFLFPSKETRQQLRANANANLPSKEIQLQFSAGNTGKEQAPSKEPQQFKDGGKAQTPGFKPGPPPGHSGGGHSSWPKLPQFLSNFKIPFPSFKFVSFNLPVPSFGGGGGGGGKPHHHQKDWAEQRGEVSSAGSEKRPVYYTYTPQDAAASVLNNVAPTLGSRPDIPFPSLTRSAPKKQ